MQNNAYESVDVWRLRLYVADQNSKSLEAFSNLKNICETYLKNICKIEVIDLRENPEMTKSDDIIAIPTLVRKHPEPVKKIIGTLSDEKKVLAGLDINK